MHACFCRGLNSAARHDSFHRVVVLVTLTPWGKVHPRPFHDQAFWIGVEGVKKKSQSRGTKKFACSGHFQRGGTELTIEKREMTAILVHCSEVGVAIIIATHLPTQLSPR